jgi:hypothetical protein
MRWIKLVVERLKYVKSNDVSVEQRWRRKVDFLSVYARCLAPPLLACVASCFVRRRLATHMHLL